MNMPDSEIGAVVAPIVNDRALDQPPMLPARSNARTRQNQVPCEIPPVGGTIASDPFTQPCSEFANVALVLISYSYASMPDESATSFQSSVMRNDPLGKLAPFAGPLSVGVPTVRSPLLFGSRFRRAT